MPSTNCKENQTIKAVREGLNLHCRSDHEADAACLHEIAAGRAGLREQIEAK